MAPIEKRVLMARLAKQRKAAGLVRISFWTPKKHVQEIKQLVRDRLAMHANRQNKS